MARPHNQVLLLGDSLLQRTADLDNGFSFQAQLQSKCIRRLDVINRGLSGWTTKNVKKYLTDIIPERDDKTPKIEYLIILLGANDAVLPVPGTTQHVPIEDYEKNLEYIINHPHIKQHNPKILLVTPPPVDEIRSGELDKADGFDASIRETNVSATYSQCVRDISARYPDIILVDLWKGIMDKAIELTPNDYTPGGPWLGSLENGNRGGLKSLIPDGLHLSGDGYRVFWELTKPHIGSEWVPGDMSEWVYPAWARFDADGNI